MSIQEKRAQLKFLSVQAKEIKEKLIEEATTPEQALAVSALRINDIIISHFYQNDVHQEFNTFKGWLTDGFCVKKGEKAFLIWGRPKAVQDKEQGKEPEEGENTDFFPLSFIFSNAQVEKLKKD